jgi:hypothetical protein
MQFSLSLSVARVLALAALTVPVASLAAAPETIDRMVTGTFGNYIQSYAPGGTFMVFGQADHYVLNDGSSWESGAGSHPTVHSMLDVVERTDGYLEYTFQATADNILYQGTDYSFGDHSAQGVLGATGPLTIVAKRGATTGLMSGWVEIVSNDATWYDTFNHYSAAVGQRVYFETTFTLEGARFTRRLFKQAFDYNLNGYVDFTQVQSPVPEPAAYALFLAGGALLLGLRRARRQP